MNCDDRVGRIMLAAQHLLGFRGVDLGFQYVERAREVGADVFAAVCPFKQHTEVVNLLGKAGDELEVFGEPALTLKSLLGFGLVIPEAGRGDLLFELR